MQLYSYWARATLNCHDADGKAYSLISYSGSDISQAAAQTSAEQLLQERYARLLADERL